MSSCLMPSIDACVQVVPREHTVGWYHSHPGFGCYLSGIDVDTTRNHQKYMGPYIAIVVCFVFFVSRSVVLPSATN